MGKPSSTQLYKTIIQALAKHTLGKTSVVWLEGQESFFIDDTIRIAEKYCIPKEHQAFNQHSVFGQDMKTVDVVSLCKKAPLGFDKQLVIVKEAQFLASIDKLIHYLKSPSPYTLFIVAYKGKTLDKRKALYKEIATTGRHITFNRLYPNEINTWIAVRANQYKMKLSQHAVEILISHMGNNLSLIDSELKKLVLNLGQQIIEAEDVFKYVGINKKYNVFELQSAIGQKNFTKAHQIASHFEKEEKKYPLQYTLTTLYTFFSKLYMLYGCSPSSSQKELASVIGISPYFVREYIKAKQSYSFDDVCLCIHLINQCFKKSVGIESSTLEKETMLTELIFKLFETKKLLKLTNT